MDSARGNFLKSLSLFFPNLSTDQKLIKEFFKEYFSFIFSGLILLGLVVLYFTHMPFQDFIRESWNILWSEDEEMIKKYFKSFGIWGPIVIIIFIVLQMFLLVFPSWLPIIIAVLGYGFWLGILINLIGVALASTLGYYIGKKLQGLIFNGFISKEKYDKMDFWITNYAFGTVILFRISPLFSNDGISFLAGIFGMAYKRYMAATFTGIVPLSFAVAYFSQDTDRIEQGLYWIGGVGAVLYGFYIYIDYAKRKKNKE